MLVLHREAERWEDRSFRDLPEYLRDGDLLVFNNSRVFKSRLLGHRTGHTGRVEIFLIGPHEGSGWRALVRPGKKLPPGTIVEIGEKVQVIIKDRLPQGQRLVDLLADDAWEAIQKYGHIPLPPYIRREDTQADSERYQTIFARDRGSVAAPTAGLHFTPRVLESCRAAGADTAEVTLHVGLGTFQPLQSPAVEDNTLHHERYFVDQVASSKIDVARRVVAVGTTSVRTLESHARTGNQGETNLFIYPGFQFMKVGAMLTNFHLPQSSLIMLVCAFAGREFTLAAYQHAVEQRYRFFSYGDCMLIL